MNYKQRIRKNSKIVKQVIKIIRSYKVKYRINWNSKECYAYPDQEFIHIGAKDITIQWFLSAIFHEIQHVINFRNNKYAVYHSMNSITTDEEIEIVARTAVKAEKYTDKYAKKLLRKHFPGIRYIGYNKQAIKWFKEEFLPILIEALEDSVDNNVYIR